MTVQTITEQITQDHIKFHRFYQEIISRHIRYIFKARQSTPEQDMKEGFDYAITIDKTNIAVRNRKHKYLQYGDLTIRTKARGNGKTEIDKIKEGCGDIYLYTWQTENGKSIDSYLLVDLEKLRISGLLEETNELKNGDNTKFCSISIQELRDKDCIITYTKF